ncbi:MAG: beta strand repeat-containing protein [Gemmataceae bacterium]
MRFPWFPRLANPKQQPLRRSAKKRSGAVVYHRPRVESLEDRLAPATSIWSGAAGDGLWSNPINWNGNVAPSPGNDIVFPEGVAFLSSQNDFDAGTPFGSITIFGSGYDISGNAIFISGDVVSAHSVTNTTNTFSITLLMTNSIEIRNEYPTTQFTINSPIDLSDHTLTLDGAGRTNLQGAISGTGADAIVKNGIGLVFINQNNTYTGTVLVAEGILVASGNGLGSPISGTTVLPGASLGTSGTLNLEPITVSGSGFGGIGAFGILPNTHGLSGGSGTYSGNLVMTDDTTFSVRAGTTLTMSGTLSGNASLTLQERGFLNFTNAMTYTGATIINGGRIQMSGNLGALINTPSIEVNLGGSLFIDNNAGPNPAPQRLPNDVDIYLNDGSTILYQINNAGGRIQEERVGNIFIGPGHNRIQITPANQGSPAQSRLFATSLQRTGPGAMVKFESTIAAARNLGTAFNQVLFDNAPPLTNGIIPWVIVNDAGEGNMFPGTYDPIDGLRAIQTGEFVTNINTAGPTDNVVLSANATLTADTTVNSLTIRTSGATRTLNLAGFTLAIAGAEAGGGPVRGLLLTTNNSGSNNHNVIINGGNGVLTFGPTGEGIIDFNTFVSNTNLDGTNVTRLVDLTISEATFLTLGSSWKHNRASNIPGLDLRNVTGTYSGTTLLTQGQVGLRTANIITIPGDFIIGTGGSTTAGNAASRAYVRLFNSNKFDPTSNVTVANNGQLDLISSNVAQTIQDVTLMPGYFVPGNGHLGGHASNGPTVTGTIRVVSPNATLDGITLIPPRIVGRINVDNPIFDIDDTPALYDLDITATMPGSTGPLVKNGDGSLILRSATVGAYTSLGDFIINGGELVLERNVNIGGNVVLADGTALYGGRDHATQPGTVLDVTAAAGTEIQPGQLKGPLLAPGTGAPFGVNSASTVGILRVASLDLSESTLVIDVRGLVTAGIDYDQLQATGAVTLGGDSKLVVDLLGLRDITTAQIPIVTSATLDATQFADIEVINNPEGFFVFPSYTNTTVFLNIIKSDVPTTLNDIYAVAPGNGTGGPVRVFDAETGQELWNFVPFPGFGGPIHVAVGDINGDLIPDIIVAAGPGGGPHVKVYDGRTGQVMAGPLGSFFAYDAGFTGGVYVAAGDVNDDGFLDIITGTGPGGGPHVKVFSGFDGSLLHNFFAYDPGFTGGVTVAAGDVNGDFHADIITGTGPGGGPHVKVFSGFDGSVLRSFFAFNGAFTGGVFVAAGDVNDDGIADIITGAGPGGGPHVRAFSGVDGTVLLNFFAYDPGFNVGVRVGAADVNGDGRADVIVGPGPGGGPHVRVFDSATLTVLDNFFAYDPFFLDGIFVSGQRSRFF